MDITRILWIAAGVLTGIYLIYLAIYIYNAKKLDALSPILAQQADPDRYISEVNKLLENKKSAQLQNIRFINLAVAYEYKRDYEKANEWLLRVNPRQLTIANRNVYWANLAFTDFYLGKNKEACAIMDAQRAKFQQLSAFEEHKAKLAILSIFYNIAQKEKKAAKKQLTTYRKSFSNPLYEADFTYLDMLLNKKIPERSEG